MAPELVPAAVLPGGRSGEYAGSDRESWKITDSVSPSVAMSGKNWWPVGAASSAHDRAGPAEPVARVAREDLRLAGAVAPVPDDVHAVGVGGDRRQAREARVVEQRAAERAVAAGVRAVVGRVEAGDRRDRARARPRDAAVRRLHDRDRVGPLRAGVDPVGQVDGAVGPDREVGELLGGAAVGDPDRLGVGVPAVGRAREHDHVVAGVAAEARPGDVDVAVALVGRDVDLVLEEARRPRACRARRAS